MKAYFVKYKLHKADQERGVCVLANNKSMAYDKAVYENIPKLEGVHPYSVWVESVTYQNGNYKAFNTFEGKPY